MSKAPFVLLVNPWVTDFAAFDLWAKPIGLLILASLLREGGCGVALLDCLDRHDPLTGGHPDILPGVSRKYGTGKFPKSLIEKPAAFAEIPRHYYRHGIHPDTLRVRLKSLPRPDLIWVTSIMTYWYPGIQQTIEVLRECLPGPPIWLGGIYARLCSSHAREKSGADEIVTLPRTELPDKIEAATGFSLRNRHCWGSLDQLPPPALDLLSHVDYAPILTSTGCPFRCPYCASGLLQPKWERKSARAIYGEIVKWTTEYGIVDFAFYDDALLLDADACLKPALQKICRDGLKVRFHTPNALHIRALTPEWCRLLYESGFTTIRLGLETTASRNQRLWGGKVETEMFLAAMERLTAAGFSAERIGVYLMAGLPGQTPEEVIESIGTVRAAGGRPHLCEYSPLPGTSMWEEAKSSCRYDLENEPLYHNNTFFACRRPGFSYEDLLRLKELTRQTRRVATGPSPP